MSFDRSADAINKEDAKKQKAHAVKAVREFNKLLKKVQKKVNLEEVSTKARLKKYISSFKEVELYLNLYMGTLEESEGDNSNRNKALNLLTSLVFEEDTLSTEEEVKVNRLARRGYEFHILWTAQESLRDSLPKEIRKFLPRNLTFDLDEGEDIIQVRDRVGGEMRDLLHKEAQLQEMISNYNDLVDEVKADMQSRFWDEQISAILTAIMMETGIRPGGNTPGKTTRGKQEIATFGARSLRPRHIQEFREDLISIEFKGKGAVDNTAEITDIDIINALTPYIERVQADVGLGGSAEPASQLPFFDGLRGEVYDIKNLRGYIKSKINSKNLEPRDFRRLRATRSFYEHFEECQEKFHEEVRDLALAGTANLKQVVAERVSDFINSAVEKAAGHLSHVQMQNTIDYYVSPMIVLNFLSQGYIEKNIQTAIVKGFDTISFDVDKFIKVSEVFGTDSYPLGKSATDLSSLLEEMDNALGERRSGVDLLDLLEEMDSTLGKV